MRIGVDLGGTKIEGDRSWASDGCAALAASCADAGRRLRRGSPVRGGSCLFRRGGGWDAKGRSELPLPVRSRNPPATSRMPTAPS